MKHTYCALVARTTLSIHCDEKGVRLLGQTGSIDLHLVEIRAGVIFPFPFVIIFTPRRRSRVEEPAFRRVPLDLFRVTERKVGKSDFTEHGFLERGCDEGIELTMPACEGRQEDSDRFVVELVGEDHLTPVFNHRLVISRMNGTGYWEE